MLRIVTALTVLTAIGTGCSGHYILTAPDQLAPAGGQAVTVVRLQRNEFLALSLPVEGAVIRFRAGDGPERAAYTDKLGFAGTTVPVPSAAGVVTMTIAHQDTQGDELLEQRDLYVWDPAEPIVAVELEALPLGEPSAGEAAEVLRRLAQEANVLYMTRQPISRHARLHEQLAADAFPQGPILPWQRQNRHLLRSERFNLPRIVLQSRLIGQLEALGKLFPNLQTGLCRSSLAAEAFDEAGLKCVLIGQAKADVKNLVRRESWAEVLQRGL